MNCEGIAKSKRCKIVNEGGGGQKSSESHKRNLWMPLIWGIRKPRGQGPGFYQTYYNIGKLYFVNGPQWEREVKNV